MTIRQLQRSKIAIPTQVVAVAIAVLLLPLTARADVATDNLLGLVSDNASLVIEVPRLEEQVQHVSQGDFYKRLIDSALYKNWTESDRYKGLTKSRESIERSTARTFAQLRRDVFGNGLVISLYKIGENRFAGIILSQAASADTLNESIAAWNKSELQNTTSLGHAGQTYFRRDRIRPGKPIETLFYAKFGSIYALTDREELIKPVLELQSRRSSTADSLATSPVSIVDSPTFRKSRAAIQREPFVAAYINPRDWDSAFPVTETSNAIEKGIGRLWQRLDSIALSINLDEGPVVEAHAYFNNQNVSTEWTATIERMQGRSELLNRIPSDAVIAFAGMQDGIRLAQTFVSIISADMEPAQWDAFRQVTRGLLLGRDLFDEIIPAFGPNFGGYAVPRPADKPVIADEFPLEGLVAFTVPELTTNPNGGGISLREAIDNGLNTGLNLAAAYANSTRARPPAVVHTRSESTSTLRWIDDLSSYRPAYALSNDTVVISTTPDMVRKFLETPAAEIERTSRFGRVLAKYFPEENQVSFVDVKVLRGLLKSRENHVVDSAVASKSLTAEDSARRLERLIDIANLFDSAFLAGHIGSDHVRFVCGGVTDPPAAPSSEAAR